MAQRIKKGDRVFVNSGKDSGKIGEVIKMSMYQKNIRSKTKIVKVELLIKKCQSRSIT